MIGFLKDRMSSVSSDLYEDTCKPNKSHTNRIIQIVSCKTALIYVSIDYDIVKQITILQSWFLTILVYPHSAKRSYIIILYY